MSSLYDRLGGETAIDAAVDKFYDKVLADERISEFFEGIDVARLRAHQKSFLTFAFGGPAAYTGRQMRAAHQRLVSDMSLDDEHFDAVMENLGGALVELGVAPDLIKEAAGVAESVRRDVLGK